jgi:hypothetical protein
LARYIPPTAANPRYGLAPVSLKPGQTRVFYMLAQEDEQQIVDRWSRYVNAYTSGGPVVRVDFSTIEDWLESQFDMDKLGGDGDPVWIRRFNPETGLLINVADSTNEDPESNLSSPSLSFDDLWEFPPPRDGNGDGRDDYVIPSEDARSASGSSEEPRQPDWRVVRLWKKYQTDTGTDPDTGAEDLVEQNWDGSRTEPPYTDNWVENDILVDRLREPDPVAFNAPDGLTQPVTSERIGFLDSRPTFDGGYDEPTFGANRKEVEGTHGCEQSLDETGPNGRENDNTGWTIVMHAGVRRNGFAEDWSARRDNGVVELDRGVLPMWCLEAIDANESYNIRFDEIPDGGLDRSDFVAFSNRTTFRRFREFVNTTEAVQETFNKTPNEWLGPTDGSQWPVNRTQAINKNLFGDYLYGKQYAANQARPRDAGYLYPELHVRSDKFEYDPGGTADPIDVSRVTDMLAPLGVGPEYAPLSPAGFGDPYIPDGSDRVPGRYLTLSEALALALGFEGDLDIEDASGDLVDADGDGMPDGDGTTDLSIANRYIYFDLGKRLPLQPPGQAPTGDWEYVFDAGHLWLDKFVPFVDQTPHSDPATGSQILYEPPQDVAIGERLTPAMKLLDSVQTATDTSNAEAFLGRAVPGRININTASLSVLRSIGMLSPSQQWDAFGVPQHWAWRLANQFGNVQADSAGPFNEDPQPYIEWARDKLGLPDIGLMDSAATLLSYRDRLNQTPYRYSSWPSDPATGQPVLDARAYSGFSPSDDPTVTPFPPLGNDLTPSAAQVALDNRRDDFGRQSIAGIPALREVPGFASAAEVLAARVRPDLEEAYLAGGLPFLAREVAAAQLDFLGTDRLQGLAQELKTFETPDGAQEFRTMLESRRYTDYDPFDSSSGYDPAEAFYADEIGNDYDEKLVLSSQVLNLVTTRSDLFAVWFVVRGYTEADVSNLRGDVNDPANPPESADPMVPSLERRYLMIVDRSKVGTWVDRDGDGSGGNPGDEDETSEIVTRPEIVLLREVPM